MTLDQMLTDVKMFSWVVTNHKGVIISAVPMQMYWQIIPLIAAFC